MRVRIGTASWSISSRYAEQVAADGSQLARYARHLNAVEINTSFYRSHQRKTYKRWAESTPSDFHFSVKLPKTVTHGRRLSRPGDLIERFLDEATGLGDKLSVLLVQLPPSLRFDAELAIPFFEGLTGRVSCAIAVEPRHASWFTPDADERLALLRIARIAADPAPAAGADKPGGWKGLAYYRWHGSPQMYHSNYEAADLAGLSDKLRVHNRNGIPVWCIFDNTASGAALGNALKLDAALSSCCAGCLSPGEG